MKTGVKTAVCFVGLAYMYVSGIHVCIDFQPQRVLNRSAFLFMSNQVKHNFPGRQILLDMELQIRWENAMSDCKIILCI